VLSEFLQVAIIINIFAATIRSSTPLLLGAMGELITERSGVMNLGVEGIMLFGAFMAWFASLNTGSTNIGILVAIVAGGFLSLLLAFLVIKLRVDQTVTGLAINLLAAGLTEYIYRIYNVTGNAGRVELLPIVKIPLLSNIPFLGEILFSQRVLTYLAFLSVPVLSWFLYRTKLGLSLRSTGENPAAVDTRGIRVGSLRVFSTVVGGMMAGLGGAFMTTAISSRFLPGMIAGRGWLAIIIVIAGNWTPTRMVIATLIFAFMDALQLQLQGTGIDIPFQLLLALPYVFALVALVSTRVRSRMPRTLGMPYIKEG
jgi:ABC-type uncharacterized transport system permease subunit